MNVDELMKVVDGLTWVSDRLVSLPENREEGVAAGLHCQLAALIVVELAKHLQEGVEPYEALRRAAVGDLQISPQKATLLQLLRPKPGAMS